MGILDNFTSDLGNFWQTNKPGTSSNWGGGTVSMVSPGNASYVDPTGRVINFNVNSNPSDVAKSLVESPYARSTLTNAYGADIVNGGTTPVYSTAQPALDAVANNAGPRSGLPEKYQTQLLDSVMPQLLDSVKNYRTDIDSSVDAAKKLYQGISDQTMKTNMQNTLNDLAKKNVLSSTVASDALAKAGTDAGIASSLQGYQTVLDKLSLKAQIPSILTQIASLGSSNTDDLQKYEFLSNVLNN